MSTLLVEDITTEEVEQEFKLVRNTSIYAVRVALMKFNSPTGDLVLKLYEGSNLLKTITTPMSTLNSEISTDYGYGMFRFDLDLPIRRTGSKKTYSITLASTIYSTSNYYSWLKNWTSIDAVYGVGSTDGVADYDTLKPYWFEIVEYI